MNLEYQLDPRLVVQVKSRVLLNQEALYVVAKIAATKLGPEAADQSLLAKYLITNSYYQDYTSPEPLKEDTVKQSQVYRYRDGDFGLKIRIDTAVFDNKGLIVIKIQDRVSGQVYMHDQHIDLDRGRTGYESYEIRAQDQLPIVTGYLSATDTLSLYNQTTTDVIKATYFSQGFSPALPAMALSGQPKGPAATMNYDFEPRKQIKLSQQGLYLFNQDSTRTSAGKTLLVSASKYPKLTKVEELVEPLIYITTKEERKRLSEALNPKQTLDQFWLGITSNPDNARRIIRQYYEQVEAANRYFTSYKEGWKTDKGIIYIIFGKPDKLFKSENQETWIYVQAGSDLQIKFDFIRKPTIFTIDNWELIRLSDYTDIWYSTVDSWRRGIIKN